LSLSSIKGAISSRNNNKADSPALVGKIKKGWGWRNITTLEFIDSTMDARRDLSF
jgi:glycine cleavage system H lipoate-binding protein